MNWEAFYRITYGLYVISSAFEGKKNGYIGNTVMQVTAGPPQIAITCNKENLTAEIISKSGYFSVSVLDQSTSMDTVGLFGFSSGREVNKYYRVKHIITRNRTPVFMEKILAWFECRLVKIVDTGTHLLFIGEVINNELINPQEEPLTYAYYHEVKKGRAPEKAPTHQKQEQKIKSKDQPQEGGYYKCSACGYEYDPAAGDPENGIPPGTPFGELPDDWQCPVCGMGKKGFYQI